MKSGNPDGWASRNLGPQRRISSKSPIWGIFLEDYRGKLKRRDIALAQQLAGEIDCIAHICLQDSRQVMA